MGKYFGTDGFRGEANVDLTVMHAFEIGRYLGWYYGREHKARIVIGKDTRRSSYMFESALCAGLTASGADAYLLHVTTTPSVAFIARSDDFDCGIMISASHNPYHDNGIKLINGRGEKMDEEMLSGIEDYMDRAAAGEMDCIPYAKRENIGRTVDYAAGRNRYIGFLISLATRSYKGKKVGLDCANGSTWMMAKSVFDALGADTYVIHNNPDGLNINVDCGSTHIEKLQQFVIEKGLDVGFAFDGDADRCLAVDDKGNIVTGDHILYVCGKYMKDSGMLGNKKIVTTVMSNLGLYKALDAQGIGYEKTAVGDKYVAENMRANGHILGGEQSGHIIFGRLANSGDGILTAIKIMEAMCESKQPLSVLAAPVVTYPQLLKNVVVDDKDGTLNCAEVKAAVAKIEAELGNEGRVLLRKSGTEPVLRVMVEAATDEKCEECVDYIIGAMRDCGRLIKVK
ncbi:MAG: phosphoglucosamine mutase [Ruminiclostridium sp.]|nr:phosphoglucosamine mutase [Ruminiclostridium sp.]MCF0136768.1 phosphoglucosamine mutase [Oscillospiraceae bacterium]